MASRKAARRAAFQIGEESVEAGTQRDVHLPVSVMPDHTPVAMPVRVIHGTKPGPVLFVSAAIHGDEVIGVEIVRRLLQSKRLKRLSGTLLAIPVVNAFGFLNRSRYLPDRRDLNRSFPGSATGSMAARLAHIFMQEIVKRSDYGIDLHSAAVHRTNLPQIRITSGDARMAKLGEAFAAPVIVSSKLRDGSLRGEAAALGCSLLLYEAGEALRFDEFGVRNGVSGILRVMESLDMLRTRRQKSTQWRSFHATRSGWLRAPIGGLLRSYRDVGALVEKDDVLGAVADPFGVYDEPVTAAAAGLIIGRANLPIVNEGDALFHIADIVEDAHPFEDAQRIDAANWTFERDALLDEDEII